MSDQDAPPTGGDGGQGRRLPPRAKSAYYSRRLAALPSEPTHSDPSPPHPPMRRRASFAAVQPETGGAGGSTSAAVKSLRRGATSMPRRSLQGPNGASVGVGSKTFAARPPLPRDDGDGAGANGNGGGAPSSDAVCGMCGNCTEIGMPPWAPERLAKVSAVERGRILRELRAKEEAGRITAEIRRSGVEAAATAANPKPRRPPKRQSTRLTAVLKPGNNSDARRQRAEAHAARQADRPVKIMSMDDMPVRAFVNSGTGSMKSTPTNSNRSELNESELDALGVDDGTLECAECDALEKQVTDLEVQLKVLRNVVDSSNDSAGASAKSKENSARNAGGGSGDETKKAAWHERVIGTFVGAPPGSETAKLKDEVVALRKATEILFKKLQHTK